MNTRSKSYEALRADVEAMPLIDCHEHLQQPTRTTDIMALIGSGYFGHDMATSIGLQGYKAIMDTERSLEERWPSFERAFNAARYTGYGRGTRMALDYLFGSSAVSLEALRDWNARLPDYAALETFRRPILDAGVEASISDNWPPLTQVMDGSYTPLPGQFLAISLLQFHTITTRQDIASVEAAVGCRITSLDEYTGACRRIFEQWRSIGGVCFKDQAAYTRRIDYRPPARRDAEELFNTLLADPRQKIAWGPSGHALSDYLMHEFMRVARDMDLPVQLHTGHMAGNYNEVAKANAAHLRPLLEMHADVRFDLFHANWPYDGDILFLAKNYPNVRIDFCWAHQVDPLYAHDLMRRCVSAVPVTQIHAFGSDVGANLPHMVWAYARLSRDVVAAALSGLVDAGYINRDEAGGIARLWLYENPKRFFRLPPAKVTQTQ